jgi:hypothetical protein
MRCDNPKISNSSCYGELSGGVSGGQSRVRLPDISNAMDIGLAALFSITSCNLSIESNSILQVITKSIPQTAKPWTAEGWKGASRARS